MTRAGCFRNINGFHELEGSDTHLAVWDRYVLQVAEPTLWAHRNVKRAWAWQPQKKNEWKERDGFTSVWQRSLIIMRCSTDSERRPVFLGFHMANSHKPFC